MNELQRSIIIETMMEAEDDISKVTADMLELGFKVFDREEQGDEDVDVVPFLEEMQKIHGEGNAVLETLEQSVMAMPEEMQEYDFTGDTEYIQYHEGVYAHLAVILGTVEEIIQTCIVIDYETSLKWAYENDMVDTDGEDE